MSSYSSPIMLIPRKLTGIPRIVTDFRHLNSRLVTLQPSIPLVRDAIQILGSSGSEVLSLADLRDTYHTLRLSKRSQKCCGITPYYGSDSYLYQRLGMGLNVSPAIWQNFIQRVLQEIPDYSVIFPDWVGEIHTAQSQRFIWRQRTRISNILSLYFILITTLIHGSKNTCYSINRQNKSFT